MIDDECIIEVDDVLVVETMEDGERIVYVFIVDVAAWVFGDSLVNAVVRRCGVMVYLFEGKIFMLFNELG